MQIPDTALSLPRPAALDIAFRNEGAVMLGKGRMAWGESASTETGGTEAHRGPLLPITIEIGSNPRTAPPREEPEARSMLLQVPTALVEESAEGYVAGDFPDCLQRIASGVRTTRRRA